MYKFFLILHIVSVVFGLGTVSLNGLYAVKAKKLGGPGQGAVMRVNFDVTMVAEKIIYLVPIFGLVLVAIGHDSHHLSMGQTWLWLSLVLYLVGIGVSHGVMVPGARKMQAIGARMASGQGTPADGAEAAATEKKLATGGMVLDLLLVVIIVLMVAQPGR